MGAMNYTGLDWREAILLGSALREGLIGAVAKAALFAVNMLVHTPRGNTYTASRYEGWLLRAGFGEVEISPIPGLQRHLILAHNPS